MSLQSYYSKPWTSCKKHLDLLQVNIYLSKKQQQATSRSGFILLILPSEVPQSASSEGFSTICNPHPKPQSHWKLSPELPQALEQHKWQHLEFRGISVLYFLTSEYTAWSSVSLVFLLTLQMTENTQCIFADFSVLGQVVYSHWAIKAINDWDPAVLKDLHECQLGFPG